MKPVFSNTNKPTTNDRHTTSNATNILYATRYMIPLLFTRVRVSHVAPTTSAGATTGLRTLAGGSPRRASSDWKAWCGAFKELRSERAALWGLGRVPDHLSWRSSRPPAAGECCPPPGGQRAALQRAADALPEGFPPALRRRDAEGLL